MKMAGPREAIQHMRLVMNSFNIGRGDLEVTWIYPGFQCQMKVYNTGISGFPVSKISSTPVVTTWFCRHPGWGEVDPKILQAFALYRDIFGKHDLDATKINMFSPKKLRHLKLIKN